MRFSILSLLALLACRSDKNDDNTDTGEIVDTDPDADGDGYPASEDCNDDDATISPSSAEICDSVDNNCDGEVDEGVTDTFYADADTDGFGDADASVDACDAPSGYVDVPNDCDDADANTYPGASERCDERDNDCDGEVDEDVLSTWYADADGDAYGDLDAAIEECDPPGGYVDNADDCDDLDDSAYPDAEEVCDEADNDCDGDVDEDVTTTFYQDIDGDSYGVADVTAEACAQPTGYAARSGDCDDAEAAVSPAATELCDGIDNDCDGTVDEDDAADAETFYADDDGDGYGDAADTTAACAAPSGTVSDDTDCDDSDSAINPGAAEVCDEADNDCDGDTDEDDATDAETFYADSDGDGYGGTRYSLDSCTQPTGYVDNADDCDDLDSSASPAGTEVCDGADNDCDGDTDEDDATDAETFYADSDGDGYGDPKDSTASCEAPSGYVDNSDDCDDSDASVSPETTWYADDDGDSYGDVRDTVASCTQPSGAVSDDSDCDDSDSSSYPGAAEVCDGADNDCDSQTDEDATDAGTWYVDLDGDGFGATALSSVACEAPSGFVDNSEDCDDTEEDINPDATEVCNGEDDDCDGNVDGGAVGDLSTWYADSDGDGYGDPDDSTEDCEAPSGYVDNDEDCDDAEADASPDGAEVCDGIDNDCDGTADNDDEVYGDGEDCAALSCQDVLDARSGAGDGAYWLDPNGDGSDVFEAYCEMTFSDGGWLAVFNWMDPGSSSTTDAATLHAALISNDDMTGPIEPDTTSTDIFTANLPLGDYTEVVYGWAASDTDDVSRYGHYATTSLSGECYIDGYCGAGVAIATMTVEPTGSSRTFYTGNSPTYPHVGIGWSGQIITWGYDRNASSYGNWANWYDTKSCCTSGNTSDIGTADWRYVIYIR